MELREAGYVVTSCIAEGGIFAHGVLLLSGLMVAGLFVWFLVLLLQTQTRRDNLRRIHDLLIEGSIGQAILFADKRSRDPVFAVVRSAIATLQATKSRDEARERIEFDLRESFPARQTMSRALRAGLVLALMATPAALAVGGQVWARGEITKAADAMAGILPVTSQADGRARVWQDGRGSLVYTCPAQLGWPATVVLLVPALVLGAWYRRYVGRATVRRTRDHCQRFIEMGARILDPNFRVYAREQGIVEVRSDLDHVPTGGN